MSHIGLFMLNAIGIFIGGGLGTLARWGISVLIARYCGEHFPWGTLVVNVTGSFAIGFFVAVTGAEGRWLAPSPFHQFFAIGLCGGYTTFSSFSLQTLALAHNGEWMKAVGNSVLSLVLCLVAVWLGHSLGTLLSQAKTS